MTNTNLLKSALIAKGYTQSSIAKKLNISTYSFHKKLHNQNEFKQSEINNLCKILNITETQPIFFANEVAKNQL